MGRSLVLGAVLLVAGAACSSAPAASVDPSGIVAPVTQRLNELGITVTHFDCPTNITSQRGASFTCTLATDAGMPVGVEVTQDSDSAPVQLHWELGPEVVATAPLQPGLLAYAHEAVAPDLQVSCPRAYLAREGDGTLTCSVQDAKGTTAKLEVPVVDGVLVADRDQWSIVQA